jgi:hypothetical protein
MITPAYEYLERYFIIIIIIIIIIVIVIIMIIQLARF